MLQFFTKEYTEKRWKMSIITKIKGYADIFTKIYKFLFFYGKSF